MSKTFCPLLFQHLATHPHGGVTHCCIADHRNAISSSRDETDAGHRYYNLNYDSILDTFNSESFRKARVQSLNNEIPRACARCFKEESQGILSKRLEESRNYPDFTLEQAHRITSPDGTIADIQFDFVELRLGNVCNVACRTCNPASSSKWASDYNKLSSAITFPITDYSKLDSFKWPEQDSFWEDLLQHCDNVKTFYINGGEPTLIKQHFTFLKRLADMGRTDVHLWYSINMTNLSEEIIDIWNQFDNVKISCSIDDLAERNTYIRHPTDWSTVMTNFERLKQTKFQLDITQTVSFMNYSNLANFYKFFWLEHGVWINHNFVYDPVYLSPSVLPEDLKQRAHDSFEGTLDDAKLQQLKTMFTNTHDAELWQRAREYTQRLDAIRSQQVGDFLPEFRGIL